jgi:threonine/homoserine/homoserine lactone efflux protein
MFDTTTLLIFLGAAVLLAVTPGPGLLYVAARSLAGGRHEGVLSSLGTAAGGMVHVTAGAIGVSALVLASAELFTVLKTAGALYLLWLGWRTFRSAEVVASTAPPAPGRAFREGAVVEALNPKTAAFFLAFLPQFVDPAAGSVALQFAALGTLCVALNTAADIAVALLAGRFGALARPALLRRARQGSGLAIGGLGVALLFARRPA